jgi:hypothetical protein
MTGKVIQGVFLGGQPKLASVRPKVTAPPPIQAGSGAPPPTAFAPRPPAAQRQGSGESFHVDPGRLGLVGSGGKPLPDGVRGQMEAAFGADFSRVRVHVGPQAERIGAIAFTTGDDIYFAPGRFQPDTMQGTQLLGHELAHVVQQRQGRVRHATGVAVAVVQDRVLEAEADRLGRLASAMAQRSLVQPKMAGFQVGPPQAAGDATHRSISATTRVAAIQRKIWKYDGAKWHEVEVGSAGAYKKPTAPKAGDYFNDISGKTGRTIEDVRAGLADLLLVTGSLGELKREFAWPDDVWKGLKQAAKQKLGVAGGHINVGKVTLLPSGNASFRQDQVEEYLLKNTWNNFLQHFMEANGQLPYIKRQQWFREVEATIIVDINFYYNRLPNEAFRFHKDTGGDNLFVNLIFNNKDKILATEWIEDFRGDAPEKKKALQINLPDVEIAEIHNTRAAFNQQRNPYRLEGHGRVRGGVVGPAAYVSWVDELVWHSTPAPLSRTGYYKAILMPANYWKYKPYAVEAMRVLYYNDKISVFDSFCEDEQITITKLNEITPALCDEYMNSVESKTGKKGTRYKAHMDQINALAALSLTDLDPIIKNRGPHMERGVDLDPDPLALTENMAANEKKTGIRPQIRRRNSFAIDNFEISQGKRSFIRTWVRVHRRDIRAAVAYQEYLRAPKRYLNALDLARETQARGPDLDHHPLAGTLFRF